MFDVWLTGTILARSHKVTHSLDNCCSYPRRAKTTGTGKKDTPFLLGNRRQKNLRTTAHLGKGEMNIRPCLCFPLVYSCTLTVLHEPILFLVCQSLYSIQFICSVLCSFGMQASRKAKGGGHVDHVLRNSRRAKLPRSVKCQKPWIDKSRNASFVAMRLRDIWCSHRLGFASCFSIWRALPPQRKMEKEEEPNHNEF